MPSKTSNASLTNFVSRLVMMLANFQLSSARLRKRPTSSSSRSRNLRVYTDSWTWRESWSWKLKKMHVVWILQSPPRISRRPKIVSICWRTRSRRSPKSGRRSSRRFASSLSWYLTRPSSESSRHVSLCSTRSSRTRTKRLSRSRTSRSASRRRLTRRWSLRSTSKTKPKKLMISTNATIGLSKTRLACTMSLWKLSRCLPAATLNSWVARSRSAVWPISPQSRRRSLSRKRRFTRSSRRTSRITMKVPVSRPSPTNR